MLSFLRREKRSVFSPLKRDLVREFMLSCSLYSARAGLDRMVRIGVTPKNIGQHLAAFERMTTALREAGEYVTSHDGCGTVMTAGVLALLDGVETYLEVLAAELATMEDERNGVYRFAATPIATTLLVLRRIDSDRRVKEARGIATETLIGVSTTLRSLARLDLQN